MGFPCGSAGEDLPAMLETWVRSLGWEDPLEKGKATHSSILAWRIPWTIQSMGSKRVTAEPLSLHFIYIYMCVCVCVCIHTHIYTYIYTHLCIYV